MILHMKLIFIAILFLGITELNVFQQNQLKGKLLNKVDKAPIVNASVINITSQKHGTTTAEDGSFFLKLNDVPLNHKILFSSVGFHDTTIVLADLIDKNITLYLKEKTYIIPEYVVNAESNRYEQIGDETLPVRGEELGSSVTSPGFAQGVFIKPNRKKDVGILQDLKVYLTGEFYDTPFYLRILQPQKRGKMRQAKLYPMSSFNDVLNDKTLQIPQSKGWHEIDLSPYDIPIGKEGLFILFVQIDTSDENRYRTKDRQSNPLLSIYGTPYSLYGHELASQEQKPRNIFNVISTGVSLGVIEKDNSRFAVAVGYIH